MPWRLRKTIYLIVIGAAVLALSIVVFVRHKSIDTDALAAIGVLGGLAIIINSLPNNGKNGGDESS